MRHSQSNRQQAGGYTLIELLAVIAIIMLLIGLLLPAVQKIRAEGPKVETRSEIGDIEQAIVGFKSTYEVSYLPSAFVLAANYSTNPGTPRMQAALADSRTYYAKVWPKAFSGGPGRTATPADTAYITLDGNQALVFFLGGISPPTASGPPNGFPNSWQGNRAGFLNSPSNPFNYNGSICSPVPTGAVAKGPFFNFKSSRLDAGGHYHDPHWLKGDPNHASSNIYYYFSSKEGNDYGYFGGYDTFLNGANNPTGFNSFGGYGGPMNPFIGSDNKFLFPGTFQIVSAGADHIPGPGGNYVPGQGFYARGVGGGFDDQANFSPGLLGSPK